MMDAHVKPANQRFLPTNPDAAEPHVGQERNFQGDVYAN